MARARPDNAYAGNQHYKAGALSDAWQISDIMQDIYSSMVSEIIFPRSSSHYIYERHTNCMASYITTD